MRDRNVLKNPELRELLNITEKNTVKSGLLVEVHRVREAIERAEVDTFEDALLDISNKLQGVLADVIELQNYFRESEK